MYENFLTCFWDECSNICGSRRIFWKVFNLDFVIFRGSTHPKEWVCLRKIFHKKGRFRENNVSLRLILKMPEDFFRKQNHRGSARQIFFNLTVEKPLKNVSRYTPLYLPFTAKRGQLGQSCKGKSCMKVAWLFFEMNVVMVGAVDEFLERFLTSTLTYLGLKTTHWVVLS